MAEYLSPGVYVEEFESGGRPMAGVSTSTAGFLGLAVRGPVTGVPQLITNPADFKRKYGGYLSFEEYHNYRFLAYAVDQFFLNGGSRCYVMRVCPQDAKEASSQREESEEPVVFQAKNPGTWGNDVKVRLVPSSSAKTQILAVEKDGGTVSCRVKNPSGFLPGDVVVCVKEETDDNGETSTEETYNRVVRAVDDILEFEIPLDEDMVDQGLLPKRYIKNCQFDMEVAFEDVAEQFSGLSLNVASPGYIEKAAAKSDLVSVSVNRELAEGAGILHPICSVAGKDSQEPAEIRLYGGSNGDTSKSTEDDFMVTEFIGTDGGAGAKTGLQAFTDNDVVSIMAIPGVTNVNVQLSLVAHCENLASRFAILDIPRESRNVDDILKHRDVFDSHYAAMYHPWIKVYDTLDKKDVSIPPSATMAGIYSRSDQERGVHKAPANEVLKGVTGFDCVMGRGEQDILNPRGVNLIRAFPGQGIRVWGARTCSSNTLWRYINVRRLFIYLEESIKANTNWIVFEPNDELLWVRVKRTIETFLDTVWRNGALFGSSPQEAYYVDIGHTTMSQDDIDNGRLICVIGVAPVKPAEFVIFRLTQKAREG